MRAGTVLLVALALSSPAGSAVAQTGIRMSIEVGYDNRYAGSKWVPVSVSVESAQAISGDLEIASGRGDGTGSTHSIAIEVPGGGKKQFDLVVPAPLQDRQVAARIVAGDDVLATAAALPLLLREGVLVGVLADSIPSGLEGIHAPPTQLEIVPALLTPEQLDLGAVALGSLSYVIVDADDLAALSGRQRDALSDWSAAGGRVLVAATTPDEVADLGAAATIGWNPAGTRVVRADHILADGLVGVAENGLGNVMVTPGQLDTVRREVFGAALRPPPLVGTGRSIDPFNEFGGSSPESEMIAASTRGGNDLQLGWFVGFLVAYLVLVGPLNYFVLRRRGRKELLWVTIPVLALAFSGVAYGLARGSRGGLDVKSAGIVWADEYGQQGLSFATVSSGTGGTRTFSFPTGAAVAPNFLPFFGATQEGTTRITSQGSEVIMDTAPFAVHAAHGTIDEFEGFIDATLERISGNELRYELRNRTPYPLNDIVLLAHGDSVEVGSLQPGETRSESYAEGARLRFDRPFIGGALRRSLDGRLNALLGPGFFGTPYVVASVEGHDLGIALEGTELGAADRSMLASPVRETVGVGTPTAIDLISTDGVVRHYRPGSLTLEDFQSAVFAYRPPAGIDPARIGAGRLRFFANGPRQELQRYDWQEERWVPFDVRRDNRLEADVPSASFSDTGEAYFRLSPRRHGFAEIYRFEVEARLS